jgi:WhiB family transcriptional regulator, redox-sensing transcriptional regulator
VLIMNWTDDAACRDYDTELFFPVGTSGPALRQAERAKAICRRCPVRAACLAWALGHPLEAEFGIWGGQDEDERRALRALPVGRSA